MSGKASVRNIVKKTLRNLRTDYIADQSSVVCRAVVDMEVFRRASVISVFLSAPTELQTWEIIDVAFKQGKRVFIPKVYGTDHWNMVMIEMPSMESIMSLPQNSWGIREIDKPLTLMEIDELARLQLSIELFITPGLAFDAQCNRLGYGRGYYG